MSRTRICSHSTGSQHSPAKTNSPALHSSHAWLSGQPASLARARPENGWNTAVVAMNSQSAVTRWRKVVAITCSWPLRQARRA